MTRKVLLLAILLFNFSTFPSYGEDQIAELTAIESDADVIIDLPEDLEPGYHTVIADVTDPDTGEVTTEEINFCKDKNGEISWENICPELDIVVDPASLENIEDVDDLPAYDPAKEPEKNVATQVAGFTALSVISAGGAAAASAMGGGSSSGGSSGPDAPGKSGNSPARTPGRREDSHGGGHEGSTEEALHAAHAKQSGDFENIFAERAFFGAGDRSITWRAPFTSTFDALIIASSTRLSKFAPLLGKIFIDASYLRAMFGSLSLISVPLGILIGLSSLFDSNFQAMPPTWTLFAAMACLSVIDALGGLVAVLIFSIGIFASGNITSLSGVLTVLTVGAICLSPPILAGSFRPFRRKIELGEHSWERLVDYLLATILTTWTVAGFIGSLNVISGKQLALGGHAQEIGIAVGLFVAARMLLEDCATYLYPQRVGKFALEQPKPSKLQQYLSTAIRALIFALIMKAFVGFNIPLLIGTVLFILPNVLKLTVGHALPRSRILHFAIPKGGVRIIAMTLLGTLFAKLAQSIYEDPQDFLTWGFVFLSIPGFVLSILGLLSDDKKSGTLRSHRNGKWVYRIGGIVVFYLIVQIALGKDLIAVLT